MEQELDEIVASKNKRETQRIHELIAADLRLAAENGATKVLFTKEHKARICVDMAGKYAYDIAVEYPEWDGGRGNGPEGPKMWVVYLDWEAK
tara:strand:+ start:13847 stop:14122 length:276 start_codon:yes stop_codon:yes gene_type:complete